MLEESADVEYWYEFVDGEYWFIFCAGGGKYGSRSGAAAQTPRRRRPTMGFIVCRYVTK